MYVCMYITLDFAPLVSFTTATDFVRGAWKWRPFSILWNNLKKIGDTYLKA